MYGALFPKDSLVTSDVRGGSPAVFMGQDGLLDALCFSGRSLYEVGINGGGDSVDRQAVIGQR